MLAPLVLTLWLTGCTPQTYSWESCDTDKRCRDAFGYGSVCGELGYCETVELHERCSVWPESVSYPVDPSRTMLYATLFDHTLDTHKARYRSAQLAAEQANTRGGLEGGLSIALLHCTNQEEGVGDGLSKDDASTEVARYLASEAGVPAIVGPASSDRVEQVYGEVSPYGTLVISPSATSPALTTLDGLSGTDANPGLLWRTAPPDSLQGKAIAEDMDNRWIWYVAVIYEQGAYGEGLAGAFEESFTGANVDVETWAYSSTDQLPEIIDAITADYWEEVLFISSDSDDVVSFLLEAKGELDYETIFLTDAARNADVLEGAASASTLFDRIRGTGPSTPSGHVTETFEDLYQSAYGEDVSPYSYTPHSYDASWLVSYGLAWALANEDDITGKNIARGLRKVSSGEPVDLDGAGWITTKARFLEGFPVDVTGASGELDYDPDTEETVAPIDVWTIDSSGSGFDVVWTYSP